MQALILDAEHDTATVQSIPIPKPDAEHVLVKVSAVGLNPVDALYVAKPIGASGRTVGTDFAGIVSSPAGKFKKGDRVAGFLQGACSENDRPGSFAEYLLSPPDLLWRVPDDMSLSAAAGVSLVALTAAQAIYARLHLPCPFTSPVPGTTHSADGEEWFLIYGASTSVALYAAQYIHRSAKTSGKRIKLIGVASKARFDMLRAKPYSYDALVDYHGDWLKR